MAMNETEARAELRCAGCEKRGGRVPCIECGSWFCGTDQCCKLVEDQPNDKLMFYCRPCWKYLGKAK